MGKKGHLTFKKRALNIQREVRPHPTHPPLQVRHCGILFYFFYFVGAGPGVGDEMIIVQNTMNLSSILNLSGFFELFLFNFLQFQIKILLETLVSLKPTALNCFWSNFPFIPSENIRKPLVIWCFQGYKIRTLSRKGLRSDQK